MAEVDRVKAMNDLLAVFRRENPDGMTDTDLVLTWLEKMLSDPKIGGGSAKLEEMEIKPDPNGLRTIYTITWKKYDQIR